MCLFTKPKPRAIDLSTATCNSGLLQCRLPLQQKPLLCSPHFVTSTNKAQPTFLSNNRLEPLLLLQPTFDLGHETTHLLSPLIWSDLQWPTKDHSRTQSGLPSVRIFLSLLCHLYRHTRWCQSIRSSWSCLNVSMDLPMICPWVCASSLWSTKREKSVMMPTPQLAWLSRNRWPTVIPLVERKMEREDEHTPKILYLYYYVLLHSFIYIENKRQTC